MQEIIVVYLPEFESTRGTLQPERVVETHRIAHTPWSSGLGKPDVHFSIWHNGETIFIKYWVSEREIRAVNTAIHSPVYEDSCVEFFICFDRQEGYYNFEFNCIGTCLAGFGKERTGRKLLDEALIRSITCEARITKNGSENINWELTVALPLRVFSEHAFGRISGTKCLANFYKCGDLLSTPHFLSWTDIQSPEPDFHQPEYFGSLGFE